MSAAEFARVAWPVAIVVLGMVLGITAMVAAAFWRHPEMIPPIVQSWSETQAVVRMIGILVIVPAICALGMLDKISGGEAITAISAIAGYVLGHAAGVPPPRPPPVTPA
jgi:hypothetical protein